jgi:AcrR family transcriptional regulator
MEMVSRRAGVSRGAQTNYYPTKRDLLLAIANQVMAEGMPKPLPGSTKTPSMAEAINALIDYSRIFFLSPRYTAMIELHVAGRHDASLAHELELLQRKSRKAMDDIWLDVFASVGASPKDARELVQMTNHFFRGVALLACIQTRRPKAAEVNPWALALKRILIERSGSRDRACRG